MQATKTNTNIVINMKTRPDTRQYSRGRLGRGCNAKTARNSKIFRTDLPTYRPTNMARCRVACPRLKIALCGIIGHRPLRGRCPKRGLLTNRWTDIAGCRVTKYTTKNCLMLRNVAYPLTNLLIFEQTCSIKSKFDSVLCKPHPFGSKSLRKRTESTLRYACSFRGMLAHF